MSDEIKNEQNDNYSLNDDRRVKTLSPGALVARRFFRNRVAVTGLVILAFMFIFSFVGGAVTPYTQDQLFYRNDSQKKQYAAVKENTEFRYELADGEDFPTMAQAKFILARKKGDKGEFETGDAKYLFEKQGEEFYAIYNSSNKLIAFGSYDLIEVKNKDYNNFEFKYELVKAVSNKQDELKYKKDKFSISEDGIVTDSSSNIIASASRYIIRALANDIILGDDYKEQLLAAIESGSEDFTFVNADGDEAVYSFKYDAATQTWEIMESVDTRVFDTYSFPTKKHPLGTDRNGMDMLTRLMYGGRVSLYIGFIVVFIESLIGVVLGGVSGYFGGWIDNLIMRIVDVFYCIPSMPLIIILGSVMDTMHVDPQIRMIYLMLILGFLGWPGIARLVRGQILSLREQEFMTATEATGIRASRRIFRHLIPNVIPQLIVTMTMNLGNTIITEATLSFLGLGVKFPFASWGNIINDVNDTYVLTNYWFIWIPAGVCLLATVLAFNLVGDGLRDAFDPKMKR
ncbi:MAG: ABC transporter permease [Lachnospiraceae bacterium]|nr:ABC transporter permease [Lachnospiraceae bacterium]